MLRTRIVTAIVLLAGLLPAMFLAPDWVWGIVSLIFLAQGAREWARLLGSAQRGLPLAVGLFAAGIAWIIFRGLTPQTPPPAGALLICMLSLGCWALFAPGTLRHVRPVGPSWFMAGISLAACWLALFEMRMMSPITLLSAMVVVWVADIGAYAGGRMFGRHRLAARVSPGKTWEGAVSGAGAVVALAFALALAWPDSAVVWSSLLLTSWGLGWGAVGLIALVAISIVGDLFESALKRSAGMKDSSQILPGHGGVLDRIDALIPAMPAALLVLLVLR